MRAVWAILLAALVQDAADTAAPLYRQLDEFLRGSRDDEVKRRLGKVRNHMRDRALVVLSGGPEEPDRVMLRVHDTRNLLASIEDHPSPDFWAKIIPDENQVVTLQEPLESPVSAEMLVDLIKERVSPGTWEGEQTIERTPTGQMLIQARPSIQHAVARAFEVLEKEMRLEWRASITVLGLPGTDVPGLGASTEGVLTDQAWEGILKRASENGSLRQLGAFELSAQAGQLVSGFSGREVTFVGGYDNNRAVPHKVRDGLCVELRAIPSGPGSLLIVARLGFRKFLAVDEVSTPAGPIQTPRFAEIELQEEDRRVPVGRPVVLGTVGPLPAETNLPPYLLVVGRFRQRP